jgi:hypothetical protein
MSRPKMDKRVLYILIVLGIMGIVSLLFATKPGIGLAVDSLHYIGASRSLLSGHGLTRISYTGKLVPMVDWPPLFPVALAVLGALGIDVLEGARWLNAILFGANIVLVGIVIYRQTDNSVWASLFGSILILTSVSMLRVHSVALTEPAFIFFTILGLFLLASYLVKPKRSLLIISSMMIALAFLTKYLGAVSVATGCIGLLILNKKTYYARLVDCTTFGAISSLPMALWFVRNRVVADSASESKMSFHPLDLDHITDGLRNVSLWILPERTPDWIMMIAPIALTGVLILVALLLRRRGQPNVNASPNPRPKLRPLLVAFILIHLLALAVSMSFVSFDIFFSVRYLSPVYVAVVILVTSLVYETLRFTKQIRSLQVVLISLCVLFAGYNLSRYVVVVIATSHDGQGYASNSWKQSETLRMVSALPADVRIYSNGYNVIYYLAGRPAFRIPAKYDQYTGLPSDKYQSELASTREHSGSQRAVLVYFRDNYRQVFPSEKELREALPLRLIGKEADGSIYEIETEPSVAPQKLSPGS